ncbi:MAG: hypothetical protein DRP38_00590 [Thermotogae bacterium]|nr:MAG: hypothetical protein DRP38_00590 [Thermotogota bacterium]
MQQLWKNLLIETCEAREFQRKEYLIYFNYMYERLVLMKELLANDGFICVHLDYGTVHYVKLMMDGILGRLDQYICPATSKAGSFRGTGFYRHKTIFKEL